MSGAGYQQIATDRGHGPLLRSSLTPNAGWRAEVRDFDGTICALRYEDDQAAAEAALDELRHALAAHPGPQWDKDGKLGEVLMRWMRRGIVQRDGRP